jgi:hypothetical protein
MNGWPAANARKWKPVALGLSSCFWRLSGCRILSPIPIMAATINVPAIPISHFFLSDHVATDISHTFQFSSTGQRLGVYPTSSRQDCLGLHHRWRRMLDRPWLNESAEESENGASMHFQSAGERRVTVAGPASNASKRAVPASWTPPSSRCRPRHGPPQQFRLLDCTSDPGRAHTCPRLRKRGEAHSGGQPGLSRRRPLCQSRQLANDAQMPMPAQLTKRRVLLLLNARHLFGPVQEARVSCYIHRTLWTIDFAKPSIPG